MVGEGARRADTLRPRRQPAGRRLRPCPSHRPDAGRVHRPAVRMTLRVLEPGLQTLVVDHGRPGFGPVRRGQELACEASHVQGRSLHLDDNFGDDPVTLRAMPGPQVDWFDPAAFFGPTYSVTPASNRMGLRLKGEPLKRKPGELVSEPVGPGAVQVVNDGQPIVLGVDGQTIGGYPKVAHMIAADLDRLGQLRPGQAVRFEMVNENTAATAYRERQAWLHEWLTRAACGYAGAPA